MNPKEILTLGDIHHGAKRQNKSETQEILVAHEGVGGGDFPLTAELSMFPGKLKAHSYRFFNITRTGCKSPCQVCFSE